MKAYELKISLKGAKPPIWRIVMVPSGIAFMQLHNVIQTAMGWYNYHLYEFTFKDADLRITNDEDAYEEFLYFCSAEGKKRFVEMQRSMPASLMPSITPTKVLLAGETKIDVYFAKHPKITYTYDFGDWWEHIIEVRNTVKEYEVDYPKVLKMKGECPPEDCGGVHGYHDFLLAWDDETHPEHKAMKKWGESQGYGRSYDMEEANDEMKEVLELEVNE